MVPSASPRFALLASLLLLAPVLSAQIHWETNYEKAIEKSKSQKSLLFIAINMEGERANEEALKVHYKDRQILKLSKLCVNLFAAANPGGKSGKRISGVSYEQAAQIEMRVREKFLGIGPDQDVVAPQHLFVSPEGKVLLSVSYRITVGELEWMFVTALKKLDPSFEWPETGRMRAPKRLKMGYEAPKAPATQVPSKEEIDKIIKDLRKGRGAFKHNMDKIALILRSDDKAAIQFAGSTLKSRWVGDGRRVSILEQIGKVSPKAWYVIVKDYVDSKNDKVRDAAIVAARKLAEKKLATSLKKQLSKEKDSRIKGHLLRALAACSPKDETAIRAIARALKGNDEELRIQAVAALALLEKRKAVHDYLSKALSDASGQVRSTAAYAIGVRREKELRQALEAVLATEQEAGAKKWMETARTCLEGGDGKAFESFLVDVVGDKRERGTRGASKKGKKNRKK